MISPITNALRHNTLLNLIEARLNLNFQYTTVNPPPGAARTTTKSHIDTIDWPLPDLVPSVHASSV